MKQFDSLWKSLIEDLISEFLRFFYPQAYKLFDMKKVEFLDKELEKLYMDKETGPHPRFVDKLVKVQLKEGGEQWILIHIEVQGYADKHFSERMFTYFYRILDRYHHPVTAIAIFTGIQGNTPGHYRMETFGARLDYQYNTYRIIDQPEEALRSDNNPFALIVLAARTALLSGRMTDEELMNRHEWIFRALHAKKLSNRKILAMYAFLRDCVHFADSKTYRIFEKKIETITGKKDVMGVKEYLIEQGRQEGRQEGHELGLEEGKAQVIKNLIEANKFTIAEIANFADVSEAFVRKIKKKVKK